MARHAPNEPLIRELRAAVAGEVAGDAASRALVTMDASNHRRVPLAVVAPRDAEDVAAALAVARAHGAPVLARGAGTSIAGQATGTGVVLDFTRHMHRVLSVDPEARTATVQPGAICDRLREAAAPHGLTFGPDPSTHARCTLGGMIGNNSCGAHSVAWGTTADSVHALSVLTYRGETARLARGVANGATQVPPALRRGVEELVAARLALLRTGYPDLPRRISGYALDELLPEKGRDWARAFTGSEGTLGVLTEATVRLVRPPAARALAVLAYADESAAADAAAGLLPHGPLTVEGMAADLLAGAGHELLPPGGAWLFAEAGGETDAAARAAAEALGRAGNARAHAVVTAPEAQRALWRLREDAAGLSTRMPDGGEAWPGWEDCAVPPARLGAYLREFRGLLRDHGLRGTPYGHFGDGCIHIRIDFDLLSAEGVARYRAFAEELAGLVAAHGGSLSGEHGDGMARAELLPRLYGDELVAAFTEFKDLWDPDGGLNPGVLARPAPLDSHLRFDGLPRRPLPMAFAYPEDGGDFSAAVRRCVGVAKCRDTQPRSPADSSVMCPSYRVTGEERHSTRGRARLLHEMLTGEVITGGWRSEEVHEALDLCLSCKGCHSDCPVGVDMATYKAEFLHHHYAGRLRPAAHYALGRLPRWLALTAALRLAPAANAAAGVPPLAALAKRLAGVAPQRPIPPLAREPFSRWWSRQSPVGPPAVLLFPDTFTNYLSPSAGSAAVRVLTAAGLPPALPQRPVCCGLTYITTGQLDQARAVLRRTLDRLPLAGDLPVTVLEPPCAAALRTDLPALLPDDPRAAQLASRVLTFAEALERHAPAWDPPRLNRPVAGQTHCHQHAVLGDTPDRRLRERAGLHGPLSGGCCGLAGNFGFERAHWDVSVACAEDTLLPSVRAATPDTLLLADGYSCRTQLTHLGGHRSYHLAEALASGL
ncbi:FAD-binding and (Fe-S)-binding domain-containing protein [Streptomyces sp. DSM 44917]|uniref:FAD-binding and (Fe-S)-binding domain-containing protein n=1 Tax=Streptomyces boetiae TaxID=3075541 RepID=A0ABU2L1E8_9ACTN|nr:FAD-binding and (Fe-S)-binding domain-containing protein [Streptomyces sp. DSM 44917]MDT0305389.1 FAD-binding and (Fe-S)-binding domain-containing protein [Streptomyces sp. DSM 44917]